jgi:hypothetical protein
MPRLRGGDERREMNHTDLSCMKKKVEHLLPYIPSGVKLTPADGRMRDASTRGPDREHLFAWYVVTYR